MEKKDRHKVLPSGAVSPPLLADTAEKTVRGISKMAKLIRVFVALSALILAGGAKYKWL